MRNDLVEEIIEKAKQLSDDDREKFIEFLQKQEHLDNQKEEGGNSKKQTRKQNEQFLRSND